MKTEQELRDIIYRIEEIKAYVKEHYEGHWLTNNTNLYIKFFKAKEFKYDFDDDEIYIYYTSVELHKSSRNYEWKIYAYSDEFSEDPFTIEELKNFQKISSVNVLTLVNKILTYEIDTKHKLS